MKFELIRVYAYGNKEEGYTYNQTIHIGYMHTRAENIKQAILNYLRVHQGITFKRGTIRMEYVYDGDMYEIRCRKSGIPLIAAIPIYNKEGK